MVPEKNNSDYAKKAAIALSEIMSNNKKDTFENINRANKGELFVLHYLSMQSAAVIPSELSSALSASTARISTLLRNLEKKGQIERDIDKSNRRNILVTITEAGREHAETEMGKLQKSMELIFIEMGEKDTAEFIRLTKCFFELSEKYTPEFQGTDISK
jgi:Transcriptional regulators